MKRIVELICSLTGADPAVVEPYIAQYGLSLFLAEHDAIEGLPKEVQERIEDVNLFVRETEAANARI